VNINVDITGLEVTKAYFNGFGRQVAFAASKALNATGNKVADAMPAEIDKAIDKPIPFTRTGVAVLKYADKTKLSTTVGFKTAQAKYMIWAVDGGIRNPGSAGLKLPSAIQVNEYGNIPKGAIAKLLAVARKEQTKTGKDKKITKALSSSIKVSNKIELFYGTPKSTTGKNWPRGIYKVTDKSLIPLIIFPVSPARYTKRLDFQGIAGRVISKEWPTQFKLALADAIRTAR
jgi:hypothetical protein